MPPAGPTSWRNIGTRIGGTITAALVLLVVGVGAGHLALSNGQALLGTLAAETDDDGVQAPRGHYRVVHHVRHGSGRFVVKHATPVAPAGDVREGDGNRRGFAQRRGCRGRACIKPAETEDPRRL